MAQHRYDVGQRVEVGSGRGDAAPPPGLYTVIRRMPNDGSDREYRVKSAHDGHERVVRESQILSPAPAQDTEQRRVFANMTGVRRG
ncbi:hypothetical protein [Elioraea rosea]|uniref:hypothetical protein n=1 Tax=Elioraea rosea TaxID=2492390 RepID=UPI0019500A38|nr:hypothetical protein [Elioraea rosea]